tara:strand:+ start:79 stop:180 length:102 start_codon:yes stop_codon:yes gene_type:complete
MLDRQSTTVPNTSKVSAFTESIGEETGALDDDT